MNPLTEEQVQVEADTLHDYCHKHGGWGSDTVPCKVCGSLSPPNPMPSMPEGLTWDQALAWGAEQINKQLTPP